MKFFRYDGTAFRFLSKICDLIILNLLWIFTSLPLVTIGASTAALYTITLKMVRGEEGYIFKGFFTAFKKNLKQATGIWLITVLVAAWFAAFFWMMRQMNSDVGKAIQLVEAALVFLFVLAVLYVLPIQARYENKVFPTYTNAVVLSLKFLPYSLAMLALIVAPILLTAFVEAAFNLLMSVWISLGVSSIALGISYLINRVFQRVEEGSETYDQKSDSARLSR